MKRLTVDSSIIVSSLLENEPRHKEALKIWNAVLSGKNVAIIPYSVFVNPFSSCLVPRSCLSLPYPLNLVPCTLRLSFSFLAP